MIKNILSNIIKPLVEPATGKILQNVAINSLLDNGSDIISETIFNDNSRQFAADVITSGINTIVNSSQAINSSSNNEYHELDLYELAQSQIYKKTF